MRLRGYIASETRVVTFTEIKLKFKVEVFQLAKQNVKHNLKIEYEWLFWHTVTFCRKISSSNETGCHQLLLSLILIVKK